MSNKYAITISPPRRPQSPRHLYKDDCPWIQKQLNRCASRYILYPEFDLSGRLHYHGTIVLNSLSSWGFVKSTIDKQLGYTCLKKIASFDDTLRWLLYCRKNFDQHSLTPIMYHTFPRGKPRLQRSAVKPYKTKTIEDYFSLPDTDL